jgi:uncharacterized protein YbjT (DUF2867 family)
MASQAVSKSVLITGCSTGIGRATALLLADRGWKVYATARRRESLADLEGKVAATLALDVCDEASMRSAVEKGIEDAYQGRMKAFAAPPEAVARVIERAISSRRPRPRYVVTAAARILLGLKWLLPDRAFDSVMRMQLKSFGA